LQNPFFISFLLSNLSPENASHLPSNLKTDFLSISYSVITLTMSSKTTSFVEWGEEHYCILRRVVLNCKKSLLKILSNKENTLFIDTEGCPTIQMFQITMDHDSNIYIFTDPVYLKYFITILLHLPCKKIMWDVAGEITRIQADHVLQNIPKNSKQLKKLLEEEYHIVDLQDKYAGASLKAVIGSKYEKQLVITNRKEFYKNKHWRYPNRSHCIYAALDVEILKELYSDCNP
jgi:hypothetical protein